MIIINDTKIENLTAIYNMALGLERWFPNNNSAFAYGTRLCEETGELVETLVNISEEVSAETCKHVINPSEGLLKKANTLVRQIALFSQHYNLLNELENQIKSDYLSLVKRGLIEMST